MKNSAFFAGLDLVTSYSNVNIRSHILLAAFAPPLTVVVIRDYKAYSTEDNYASPGERSIPGLWTCRLAI